MDPKQFRVCSAFLVPCLFRDLIMSKKFIFINLLLLFFFAFPILVVKAVQLQSPIQASSIDEVLHSIWVWIFRISIPLVAIFAVWAGFLFAKSGGQPEKIKKAREALLFIVVGLVVVLLSGGIVNLVGKILGQKPEVANETSIKQLDSMSQDSFGAKDFTPVGNEEVPPPPAE